MPPLTGAGPLSERYARQIIGMRSGIPAAAPVEALLALRYSSIRWCTRYGGYFTALDECCFPAIIVADVAPIVDGYPRPVITPARVSHLCDVCQMHLQEAVRFHKMRVDHLVLPEGCHARGDVPLSHRLGVAWAFADTRLVRDWPDETAHRRRIVTGIASRP